MPLSRLLLERRDSRSEVAWRWSPERAAASAFTWGEFQRHVGGLRERIERGPQGPWLLATEDAYAFAVGLFALWHSGRWAISPPNHQAGTLGQLQRVAGGVLSDRADWFPSGESIDPLREADGEPSDSVKSLRPLSAEAPAVELFTSGTTGAGKSVVKRLSNLQEEVKRLEALWGDRIGNAVVFGSASHQHLYGMLFRVLWPLAVGRSFQSDLVLHASELIPRMRERGDCVLASVPSHLKRMVKQRRVEELRHFCRATFSSGGLLQTETAQAWRDAVGEAPYEVFGSTETGGIAWRAQNEVPRDCGWTPLPDVEVSPSSDGRLEVRSPFASAEPSRESIVIGDRIRWLSDGRFELDGRADRVVKVAEKRLDLEQMESALRSHPFVDEVALVLVEQEGDSRVAAVVVASDEGRAALEREGRVAYGRSLSASLEADWDRVLLPRLWRSVDALPENSQGKVTTEALRALFSERAELETRGVGADLPNVIEQHVSGNTALQVCSVPDDLRCFPDHFPGFPVVPGVLQLDWALKLAELLLGHEVDLRELEALKFGSTLGPGERFQLQVERNDRGSFSFRIWSADREFASGRARIAGEPRS